MGNEPKILNLDDLEHDVSDIAVKHKGTSHYMKVLDVDGFIEQQKRAMKQQQMVADAEAVGDQDMVEVVSMIRDSIQEFFPTLPVGELPTPSLFTIFGWLNDMSSKINEVSSPDAGEGVTVGNEVAEQS
jgi:hypothetical protein